MEWEIWELSRKMSTWKGFKHFYSSKKSFLCKSILKIKSLIQSSSKYCQRETFSFNPTRSFNPYTKSRRKTRTKRKFLKSGKSFSLHRSRTSVAVCFRLELVQFNFSCACLSREKSSEAVNINFSLAWSENPVHRFSLYSVSVWVVWEMNFSTFFTSKNFVPENFSCIPD